MHPSAKTGDQVAKQCLEHFLLVLEVVVHESWRHTGLCRHCRDGRARVPVVGKNGSKGSKDLCPPLGAIAWSAHSLVV